MISHAHLDVDLATLCRALDSAVPSSEMSRVGGEPAYPLPRARSAVTWLLDRLGVGPGDEVAMPTNVCPTLASGVRLREARAIAFGLDLESVTPSVDHCRASLSSRTKLMVVPHLYGARTPMDDFRSLAEDRGLVLLEDSAHRYPAVGEPVERSATECTVYSYNYNKPVSTGWGGCIVIPSSLQDRLGVPEFAPMDDQQDRMYAAALLLQQAVLDESWLRHPLLSDRMPLDYLKQHGPGAVGEVLDCARAADPGAALRAWCDAHLPVGPSPVVRLPPELKRAGKRAISAPLAMGVLRKMRGGAKSPPPSRTLLPGGLCERMLRVQREVLAEGLTTSHRASVAAVYARELEPRLWQAPFPGFALTHWLSYPAAMRSPRGRDRLVVRTAKHMGVDVYPYMWPFPLHRTPRLRGVVVPGPGAEVTASWMRGLLNLPVHAQVDEHKASELASFLNRRA